MITQKKRDMIREQINSAKERDGENAEKFVYFIRGPVSNLEIQRRKKRVQHQDDTNPNSLETDCL